LTDCFVYSMGALKKVLLSFRALILLASGAMSIFGLYMSYKIMGVGWLMQAKYWTNWSVFSHIITSLFHGILGLLYVFNFTPSKSTLLFGERLFAAACGLCTCVSIMFWGLYLQDPTNVFQTKEAAEAVPAIAQHAVHTIPASSLIADLIFAPSMHRPILSLLEEYLLPLIITIIYTGVTLFIGLVLYDPNSPLPILSMQWPYGFMNGLPVLGWVILLSILYALMFFVQFILRLLRTRSFHNIFQAQPVEAKKDHTA